MKLTDFASKQFSVIHKWITERHETAKCGSTMRFMVQVTIKLGDSDETSTIESIMPLVSTRNGKFVENIVSGYAKIAEPAVDIESSPPQDCGEHYNNL